MWPTETHTVIGHQTGGSTAVHMVELGDPGPANRLNAPQP